MKSKAFILLVITVVVLSLGPLACSNTPAPSPANSPVPTAAPSTSPTSKPATTTAAAPPQTYELKWATYMAPNHYYSTDVTTPFAKEVETKSNGRVKVTVYYSESLGKSKDQYDMVANGIADISWVAPSYTPGRFPLSDILTLSFAYRTATEASFIAQRMYPYLKTEYPEVNMLAVGQSGPNGMAFRTKRVTTLEELKGLKVRSAGGQLSDTLTVLGAVPVDLAAGEMYTALERGTIDGIMMTLSSMPSYKVDELIKYALICGLGSATILWPINKATWAKLPPDLQKIVADAAAKLPDNVVKISEVKDQEINQSLAKRGVEVSTLSGAELNRWREKVMPTYDKWVASTKKLNLPADEVMTAFKKAINDMPK